MKSLTIGQLVRVSAIADVGYYSFTDESRRSLMTFSVEPFLALIVGQVVKQTGEYAGGRRWHGLDFEDYEPPHLKVGGTVTLWQVRAGMVNKPVLVRDEDLEPSDEPFKLPRRAIGVPKRTYAEMADPPLDVRFTKREPLLLTYQPEVFQ